MRSNFLLSSDSSFDVSGIYELNELRRSLARHSLDVVISDRYNAEALYEARSVWIDAYNKLVLPLDRIEDFAEIFYFNALAWNLMHVLVGIHLRQILSTPADDVADAKNATC